MDSCELLTDARWNIVKELSKQNLSPTELAKRTKTSISNISQQLRLLEAYGYVSKIKQENNSRPGKPKSVYSISKEVNHVTIVGADTTVKKELNLDFFQRSLLYTISLDKPEVSYFVQKFMMINDEISNNCEYIGLTDVESDKIHLLLITDNIKEIREKYSNQEITNFDGKKKLIVCWTHSIEEVKHGLKGKDEHFEKLVSKSKTIMSKNNEFRNLK